jgi:hypothetical protein
MIQCAAAGGIKSKPISLRSIAAFFCLCAFENEFSTDGLFHDPVRCRGRNKSKPISLTFDHGFFCLCVLLKINFRRLDYFHDPVRCRGRNQIKTYLTDVRSRLFLSVLLLKMNFQRIQTKKTVTLRVTVLICGTYWIRTSGPYLVEVVL